LLAQHRNQPACGRRKTPPQFFSISTWKFYYNKSDVQIDLPRYTTEINQFYLVGTVQI